ncbi:hypothetical protein GO491_05375 [Flavobacteriaceae bacterium Ap0902]|nr:hypothetical protein [Flavobacteriaceae bacterium Ap0902]
MNIYIENQRFSQYWLWLILIIIFSGILYDGTQHFTNYPSTSAIIGLCITFLIILFFIILKLRVVISEDGIAYSFFPIIKEKHLSWDKINTIALIEYNPIREFGGWGFRYNPSKNIKAYNTGGNVGLLINKNLLIGLKKPTKFQLFLSENITIRNKIVIKK